METILQNGTIRHILGYFGIAYITLSIFRWLGMFKSLTDLSGGQIAVAIVVSVCVATVFEIWQDTQTKGYSSFSIFDIITSAVGGGLGTALFYMIGITWYGLLISLALISFAIFDYKTGFVADKTRRDL